MEFTSGAEGQVIQESPEMSVDLQAVEAPEDLQVVDGSENFQSGELPETDTAVEAPQNADIVVGIASGPEIYPMTVEDYGSIMVRSIPVGVFTGAIFMIVGLAVLGIVKIFKRI